MIKLEEVDYKFFKDNIYEYYVELFPEDERQPLKLLEKLFQENILKFMTIMKDNISVGFIIYVTIKDNPYVWLDYFAIYKQFQNKSLGSNAIKRLKKYFNDKSGIYGEIEKIGKGNTEEENNTRLKRAKFWESLGFEFLDYDLDLYDVLYTPCVLKLDNSKYSDKEILEYGFSIYKQVQGEENLKKHCFVIEK